MGNQWFTVSQVEEKTGIPHQTIRRYIKIHGHHLNLKKQHKSYLFNEKSIKVILQIRSLYSEGLNSDQVDDALSRSGVPLTVSVSDGDEQVNVNLAETLLELKRDVNLLHEQLREQQEINKALVHQLAEQNEQMKKQQQYLDEKLSRRDEALLQSLRQLQETKRLIAAGENKKKWWQFWRN
jgi:DNA-binding transcriptional MerR regulator